MGWTGVPPSNQVSGELEELVVVDAVVVGVVLVIVVVLVGVVVVVGR